LNIFYVRPFAFHRQQTEKDKQMWTLPPPPGKISADAHAWSLIWGLSPPKPPVGDGIGWSHGRSEDFFQGRPLGIFPKFFQGGPKVVKFVFYQSKLKKQPFFSEIFKIQGEPRPPCLPPSDIHGWSTCINLNT